jgi:hypothetical protein
MKGTQMEKQIYLLVIRDRVGAFTKQKVFCTLEEGRYFLECMMLAGKYNRGEIVAGDKDYIGDFRVKPIESYQMGDDRLLKRWVSSEGN